MNADSQPLGWLVDESFSRRDIHPALKRMAISAALASVRKVAPENYAEKCHGASLALYMILRTLRIRSTICGGTVSWLFGGTDVAGSHWQTKCGFWTHNPSLPTPHAWLLTEFGGHVDLTCSFFHMTYAQNPQGFHTCDKIPIIWMKAEHLAAIHNLRYSTQAQFRSVDLDGCDELAREAVVQALNRFWVNPTIESLLQPCADPESLICKMNFPDLNEDFILDGPESLDRLRQCNSWVARNISAPTDFALARPPGASPPSKS